jgi:hypothetical protein
MLEVGWFVHNFTFGTYKPELVSADLKDVK